VALVSERTIPTERDWRLSAKLVPTFAVTGCCVVSATDLYGRIFGFLDDIYIYVCVCACVCPYHSQNCSPVAYLHTIIPVFYDIPIWFNNLTFRPLFTSYIYFYYVNKTRTTQCALQNVIQCIFEFLCLSYFINSTSRGWSSTEEEKTNFKAINWALQPGSYKTHTASFTGAFRWERYYRMFSIIICCLPACRSVQSRRKPHGKKVGSLRRGFSEIAWHNREIPKPRLLSPWTGCFSL
jgi:hypothetical protein